MTNAEAEAPTISVMLAVRDAQVASAWYQRALGAAQLWSLESVVGLAVEGAVFLIAEPEGNVGRLFGRCATAR